MSKILGYSGPAYPLYSQTAPMTAITTAIYNAQTLGFKSCENAFFLASAILGGRDIIEEFVAAEVWPLSEVWKPSEIVSLDEDWASQKFRSRDSTYDLKMVKVSKTSFLKSKKKLMKWLANLL
jgi:hypothetical protein